MGNKLKKVYINGQLYLLGDKDLETNFQKLVNQQLQKQDVFGENCAEGETLYWLPTSEDSSLFQRLLQGNSAIRLRGVLDTVEGGATVALSGVDKVIGDIYLYKTAPLNYEEYLWVVDPSTGQPKWVGLGAFVSSVDWVDCVQLDTAKWAFDQFSAHQISNMDYQLNIPKFEIASESDKSNGWNYQLKLSTNQ